MEKPISIDLNFTLSIDSISETTDITNCPADQKIYTIKYYNPCVEQNIEMAYDSVNDKFIDANTGVEIQRSQFNDFFIAFKAYFNDEIST